MNKGLKFLSDLKLYSDYFKWRRFPEITAEGHEIERYENWNDACADILSGHFLHYKDYADEIRPYLQSASESMGERLVLASQRNLQYRGPEIKKHNARMYNCVSMHLCRNRAFQEIFYLGLCGCGVGVGLLRPFVDNLSRIDKRKGETKTFVIPDSIEGWADALGILLSSYFVGKQPFPEYAGCKVRFDYSEIREQGAFISGGFKAPGPEGLKQSLEKIEALLENWIETEGNVIRPILGMDIICHASDAVLSGGVRRSALDMILDPNDEESIMAKIGDWRTKNPQRGRTNNSVLMIRGEVTKEYFEYIVGLNEGDSDIGFVFANSWFDMFNPCFEISKIPCLVDTDYSKIIYNEIAPFVKKYEDQFGVQGCNLTEINAQECTTEEKFLKACKDASILGTFQAGYTNFPYLGRVSEEIFKRESLLGVSVTGWMNNPKLFNADLLRKGAEVVKNTNKELAAIIKINPAARTTCVKPSGNASVILGTASGIHPEHSERYFRVMQLNKNSTTAKYLEENMSFLLEDSVWSATSSDWVVFVPIVHPKNGLFKKDLKGVKHLELIKLVQENWVIPGTNEELCAYKGINHNVSCFPGSQRFLTDEGMKSFEEVKEREFVNVLNGKGKFSNSKIVRGGKQEIWEIDLKKGELKKTIKTTENHGWVVINPWDQRSNTKSLLKKTSELLSGMKLKLPEFTEFPDFNLEAFLHGCVFGDGTLHKVNDKCQIYLFTDSVCLGKYFEKAGYKVIDRGDHIRIYGLPNHWKALPDIKDSSYIRSFISGWFATDGHISKDARSVSISSVVLDNLVWLQKNSFLGKVICNEITKNKTHKNSYSIKENFYVITLNKDSLDLEFFKHEKKKERFLNYLKVKSQKSKKWKVEQVRKTDDIEEVYCVEEPETQCFILEGNILTHNCTVIIDNKREVVDYIWDNKESFTAVSFLSDYGDKDFNQAPFTSVLSLEEIVQEYGNGALLASGLIVDALHVFDENLWEACDWILNTDKSKKMDGTRHRVLLKEDWLKRAKKFAKNYFKGDLKKLVYCLKDVHLFHKWQTINRQFKEVDFNKILKKVEYKQVSEYASMACSGDQCQITRI